MENRDNKIYSIKEFLHWKNIKKNILLFAIMYTLLFCIGFYILNKFEMFFMNWFIYFSLYFIVFITNIGIIQLILKVKNRILKIILVFVNIVIFIITIMYLSSLLIFFYHPEHIVVDKENKKIVVSTTVGVGDSYHKYYNFFVKSKYSCISLSDISNIEYKFSLTHSIYNGIMQFLDKICCQNEFLFKCTEYMIFNNVTYFIMKPIIYFI